MRSKGVLNFTSRYKKLSAANAEELDSQSKLLKNLINYFKLEE
ncbi:MULTISPECIES: hypothetical protein [unclassified Carboxylicivirga]